MSEQKNMYQLGGYYRFKVDQSEDNVSVGAFGGTVAFTIWKKGERTPIRVPLNRATVQLMKHILRNLLKAQPDTAFTLDIKAWNPNDRRLDKDILFKFVKDDKQRYSIEVNSKKLGTPIKFKFAISSAYGIGTDEFTEGERSQHDLCCFVDFLEKEYPLLMALSTFNKPERTNNNNNGGGNRNSSSNSSSGPSTSSDEEAY